MKSQFVLALLTLCGCTHPINKGVEKITEEERFVKINKNPRLPPILIEINSIPHPFDVAGTFPYALWVNGMGISNPDQAALSEIIKKIGKENIPPIDMRDIHKGWTEPRFVNKQAPQGIIPWKQIQ
jgi:hypothetical protein